MSTGNLSNRRPLENSTAALITRFRAGDRHVLPTLCSRYLAPFQRWIHCRAPIWARDSLQTETLVEKSLRKSLDDKEDDDSSARRFQSQLRRRILDGLEDELNHRKPPTKAPTHPRSSALEKAIDRESYERYESALQKLSDEDREILIARIELDFPYSKVADFLGKAGPEEAREAVIHALLRLAKAMGSST